jgi:uncharacterized protein (DUF885 family)
MRYRIVTVTLLSSLFSYAQNNSTLSKRFNDLLQNYYESYLKLNPSVASFRGDYRYNDQWENSLSQPYRDQSKRLYTHYLDSLRLFPVKQLSERDRLSYQIFEYTLQRSLKEFQFQNHLVPTSQMRDYRIEFSQMGSGSSTHPFKTVKDYEDFFESHRRICIYYRYGYC